MTSTVTPSVRKSKDSTPPPVTVDEPNATIKRAFDRVSDYPNWAELNRVAQTQALRLGIEDKQISELVEQRNAMEASSSVDAETVQTAREETRRYIVESFADRYFFDSDT